MCVVWFDFPHLSRDLVYCLLQKMWTRVVFLDVVQLSDIYFRFDFFESKEPKGPQLIVDNLKRTCKDHKFPV